MYFNRKQSIVHKPSQLVENVKRKQRARYRARQRKAIWTVVKGSLIAGAIMTIGGLLLGGLLYTTLIAALIAQAGGVAG